MPISPRTPTPAFISLPTYTSSTHPVQTLEHISAPTAIEHIYPLSPDALHQRIEDMKAGRITRVRKSVRDKEGLDGWEELEGRGGYEGLTRKDSLDKAAGIRERARIRHQNVQERGARSQTPFPQFPRYELSVYSLNSEYSLGKERSGSVLYGMLPEYYHDDRKGEEDKEEGEKGADKNKDEAMEPIVPEDPANNIGAAKKKKRSLAKSVGRTMGCRLGSVTPGLEPESPGQEMTKTGKDKWYKSLPRGFKIRSGLTKQGNRQIRKDDDEFSQHAAKSLGKKFKLKTQARKTRAEEWEVESSDTCGPARLVDLATLSSTNRRVPETLRPFSSAGLEPQAVEHTSASPLPSSQTSRNDCPRDPRREDVTRPDRGEANLLSNSIKQVEKTKDIRDICASSPILTSDFLSLREPSILGPRDDTEDQTVARLRQRLDEIGKQAGTRAWEDIHRRRGRSRVNGYDSTTFPGYQRHGSRGDIHGHVSREVERLRRGFVENQLNGDWEDAGKEEKRDRHGLPTPSGEGLLTPTSASDNRSHRQANGVRKSLSTCPEARQDVVSHASNTSTPISAHASPPSLRRVRFTLPTQRLTPHLASTTQPPNILRTNGPPPTTIPNTRHTTPTPPPTSTPPHQIQAHERYPPIPVHNQHLDDNTAHEWRQDEYGRWELRELRDGEERLPRPEKGVWRDV